MRTTIATLVCLALLGLGPACSGGDGGPTAIELPIASLTIANDDICNGVPEGAVCPFQVVAMTAEGQQIADPVVRWSSGNSSVLSIDPESGVAEARSGGTTFVRVANSTDTVSAQADVWILTPNPK